MNCISPVIRRLGQVPYLETWQAMKGFTDTRMPQTPDELWLCEHPPIYTLGQAADLSHLLVKTDIPLIHTDRGGQITYHGPGQIVLYFLIDMARSRLKVRALVSLMEEAILSLLTKNKVSGFVLPHAPGVYVGDHARPSKIASLGLRVRKKGCYHGLSFNANMDLSPFEGINPCGYSGMHVTQASHLGFAQSTELLAEDLLSEVLLQFSEGTYTRV